MKRFSIVILLLAFCSFATGIAETEKIRGKVEMNVPNAPTSTFEINLDASFFSLLINFNDFTTNLPEYAEYAEMVKGVCIRSYEIETRTLTEINNRFLKILKKEKWEDIIKVKDQLYVSLLYSDTPGILNGIFVSFTDKNNTTFVNIFGNIDFQKLGTLFKKFMVAEPEFLKDLKIDTKFKIDQ